MTLLYKRLVILNNKFDINYSFKNNFFSYSLDHGNIISKNVKRLNSSKDLHKQAFKLKELYVDEVAKLNQYFDPELIYKNNFSYFYLTDISCKRTEYLFSFLYLCHLSLLKEIIDKYKIDEIVLINCDADFLYSIKSFYKKNIIIKNKKVFKNFRLISIDFFRQFKFLLKLMLFITIIKLFFKRKKTNLYKKLFFSSYPKNFYNFHHIKYGKFVSSNDGYLISLFTDMLHQSLNLFQLVNNLRKIQKSKYSRKFIVADLFLNYTDIFTFLFYYYKTFKIYNLNFKNHFVNDINISHLLKSDLKKSVLRIPRLLVIYNSFKRISLKINKPLEFYYYLFEYSFGRLINYAFQSNKLIKRIGFQHGPSGYLKLICYISKIDVNNQFKYNLLLPDKIFVEDNTSKEIYENGNYKNVHCLKEIPRLHYLEKIRRKPSQNIQHLIVAGLHDGYHLLNFLRSRIIKNPNIKYIFKPHPKSELNKIKKYVNKMKVSNLSFAFDHISDYLTYVHKVYFTYTSIGYEAEKLGIEIETVFSDIKLNESVYCKEIFFK